MITMGRTAPHTTKISGNCSGRHYSGATCRHPRTWRQVDYVASRWDCNVGLQLGLSQETETVRNLNEDCW